MGKVKETIREWGKIRDQSLQGALHGSGLMVQGEGGFGGSCQEPPATRKGLPGRTVEQVPCGPAWDVPACSAVSARLRTVCYPLGMSLSCLRFPAGICRPDREVILQLVFISFELGTPWVWGIERLVGCFSFLEGKKHLS